MDSGIRPPGGMEGGLLPGHALERILERLLDRGAMILALPAHERPTVIFDDEPPARHGSIVPAGMAKPRSSSSALIGARPARWTFRGWIAPAPAAMVSCPSSTSPGFPEPPATSVSSSF